MISDLLKTLAGLFGGGAGATVGTWATNLAALAAVLGPVGLFLANNKNDVFLELTYGDLAFWGVLFFVMLKMAHWTRRPTE